MRSRLPLVGRSTSLFHVSKTKTTTTTTLLWKNMTAFPTRLSRLRLSVIFFSLLSVLNLLHVHKTLLQSGHAGFEQNAPPVPSQSGDSNMFSSTSNFVESSTNRRLFSDPNEVHRLVALGPNFLTTKSGCRIARWFYPTTIRETKYKDCREEGEKNKRKMLFRTAQLHHNDTIYVTFTKLEEFVREMLPTITVDVVVLSGQIMKTPTDDVVSNQTIQLLLDSPHVLHWFCQNLPLYGGEDPYHPKISPFPYGLREVVNKPELNQALEEYKEVFLQTIRDDVASTKQNSTTVTINRTTMIYAGYIRKMIQRANIPTLPSKVEPAQFYRDLANSTYILSPNGDRPECYRHYEAIGLGAVPITELDPILFRHLREGPVIFNNTNWNLTSLESELVHHQHPPVVVNRNMVLEEYWIEFIDWTVGRSLRWWGRHSDKPQTLEGILDVLERERRKRNREIVKGEKERRKRNREIVTREKELEREEKERRKRNREIVTREKEREREEKTRIREEARQRAMSSGKFARQESNITAEVMR